MSDPVRRAREELIRVGLLADVSAPGVVPDLVLRSWRRSIGSSVESAALCRRYEDVDADSILHRAAEPVLDRWQDQLADTGTTLFLSDRAGRIVARRTSDGSLRRRLDRVHAAEGFDYSEDSVGTNGLGTSMVEKRAVYIQGSQHYNDALATLACAAVPVCAPTGSVAGSVSLGGPVEIGNPLMVSVTQEIGRQIEERLRAASRPQDLALAMSFMRYTNSRRPTVVMDQESVLANTPGLPYVDVGTHVALWELLSAHDWSGGGTAHVLLEGTSVEVSARRVVDGPRAHFVLHFADLVGDVGNGDVSTAPERRLVEVGGESARVRPAGNGVVVVEGPRGSGRATVALELHAERAGDRPLDAITVSQSSATPWGTLAELLEDGTDVLLRRVEDVPEREAGQLAGLVDEHRAAWSTGGRTSTLLLTVCQDLAPVVIRSLIEELGPTARTEALSGAPERIPGLVKRILERVDPEGRHTMSPAALQSLMQGSWPGDLAELAETVTALVREMNTPVIQRQHLPRHLQQPAPRRSLTMLEAAEREAIIKALDAAGGNKSEAAALLGLGRTTLYRRIRQLGLDADERSL